MKLIVGLGNPGKAYANTRHNIGFMLIDEIARYLNVSFSQEKFGGLFVKTIYQGEELLLLKPQKYINLSGEVIQAFLSYFKIDIDNFFVIHDDLDMPVGKIKIKAQGSSGGHNGLKNIELHLHTQKYKRMKVGISNDKKVDTKDYVLGRLTLEEKEKIDEIQKLMPSIFQDYLSLSFDLFMNKYNRK